MVRCAPWIAARGRRVLACDVRGRGRSAWDPQPMRYVPLTYARDVLALMQQAGIARAVFVGTSMGGLITMTLAQLRSPAVAAAVLNDVGPELAPAGLARIASYTGVMFVLSKTGVKSAEDLRRIPVVVGSWGNTTDSFVTPTLLNAFAGTKFKIVIGYRGASDVDLAIERGEAEARVASWTALKTTRSDWLRDGRIVVPFQTGIERHPDLPQLPLIRER